MHFQKKKYVPFFCFTAFNFAVVPQITDLSLWTTTWLTLLTQAPAAQLSA
jgi:hypothetical protein